VNTNLHSLLVRFAAAGLVGLLYAGCTSLTPSAQTQKRIQERPSAYNSLKPEQQNDVLGGAIQRGYTSDIVYLTLGQPRKVVSSADGEKAMWVYTEYYAANSAVTVSFNNPNSSHYTPGMTGGTAPPARGGEGAAWLAPSSMGTDAAGPVQSLDLPEMKSKTVYVFFFRGRVCEIKLDGDASDQQEYAANKPVRKKAPTETGFSRSAYGGIDP
jgi:hypothetical protein